MRRVKNNLSTQQEISELLWPNVDVLRVQKTNMLDEIPILTEQSLTKRGPNSQYSSRLRELANMASSQYP